MSGSSFPVARVSVRALFFGFFVMGISGFGGVLPFARRLVVERRGWMADSEFTEIFSLCQLLPGPNIVNLSVIVGDRFQGVRGAIACFLGLLTGPFMCVLLCAALYVRFSQVAAVHHALAGVAAAAAGLTLATGLKMAKPYWRRKSAVCIMLCTFLAVAWLKLPLVVVLLALAPVSLFLSGRE